MVSFNMIFVAGVAVTAVSAAPAWKRQAKPFTLGMFAIPWISRRIFQLTSSSSQRTGGYYPQPAVCLY
jgi:hypothetical protein